jgi:hypothetical protein
LFARREASRLFRCPRSLAVAAGPGLNGHFHTLTSLFHRQDEPSLTTAYNHCKQIVENFFGVSDNRVSAIAERQNPQKTEEIEGFSLDQRAPAGARRGAKPKVKGKILWDRIAECASLRPTIVERYDRCCNPKQRKYSQQAILG